MTRRQSHLLRIALLFAVLGFATALTVAYAAAIFTPILPPARGPQVELIEPAPDEHWRWMVNQHVSLGHTTLVFRRASRHDIFGIGVPSGLPSAPVSAMLPHWSAVPARGMKVDDHAFGWPLRCLRGVQHAPDDKTDFRVLQGWTANMGEIWLPRRFLWWALVGNSVFFAASWWLLLVAPGMTRRALRRRRGLCPGCGYDLRHTLSGMPCPECGATSSSSPTDKDATATGPG